MEASVIVMYMLFLVLVSVFPVHTAAKVLTNQNENQFKREGVLGKNKLQLWVDFSVIPSFLEIKDAYNYDFFA